MSSQLARLPFAVARPDDAPNEVASTSAECFRKENPTIPLNEGFPRERKKSLPRKTIYDARRSICGMSRCGSKSSRMYLRIVFGRGGRGGGKRTSIKSMVAAKRTASGLSLERHHTRFICNKERIAVRYLRR